MKIVILAAGQGSRLRPYTNDRPKCMVPYHGKEIINYITEAVSHSSITHTAVVAGYKSSTLKNHLADFPHEFYVNDEFATTNMVFSLFKAEKFLDAETIVSYSDIVYSDDVLNKLISAKGDICVVVDKSWRELWTSRFSDPLSDAETLKIGEDGFIVEIGRKPKNYTEIEGQYIGLLKFSKDILQPVMDLYHNLPKDQIYDGKNYDNMYMTTFIQILISNKFQVTPVFINGGWVEIDSPSDLDVDAVKGP